MPHYPSQTAREMQLPMHKLIDAKIHHFAEKKHLDRLMTGALIITINSKLKEFLRELF
jgi:hypothetical protein